MFYNSLRLFSAINNNCWEYSLHPIRAIVVLLGYYFFNLGGTITLNPPAKWIDEEKKNLSRKEEDERNHNYNYRAVTTVCKCVSVFGLIIYRWHFHRSCAFLRILNYHYNLEGFSLTSAGFLTPTFLLIKRISDIFKISFSTSNLNIFCAFLILPSQSLIPWNKLSVETR